MGGPCLAANSEKKLLGLHLYRFSISEYKYRYFRSSTCRYQVHDTLRCHLSQYKKIWHKSHCKESHPIGTGMQCDSCPNRIRFPTAPVCARTCIEREKRHLVGSSKTCQNPQYISGHTQNNPRRRPSLPTTANRGRRRCSQGWRRFRGGPPPS